MPESAGKAVFLSYASQDAEAAGRICAALRASGVEVWFDRDELVGGDAWDQKIRRQIKDCALFMPVISANTNARAEGYFRLEWKLAVDRSHLMADDAPFLFPVVIDDTSDAATRVPDRFREVQWTRLNVKDTPETLAARVGKLLQDTTEATRVRPAAAGEGRKASAPVRRGWVRNVSLAGGMLIALLYALRPIFFPTPGHEKKGSAVAGSPAAAPVSEARQLTARALELMTRVGFTREDLTAAEDLARRATEKDPDSAAAWGVRAGVQAGWIFRNWDRSEKRRQEAQALANRALALDANEPEALLVLGHILCSQLAFAAAETHLRSALAAHPNHVRIARALSFTFTVQDRGAEARPVLLEAVKRAPRDPLVRYELALSHVDWGRGRVTPADVSGALEQLDAAIALQPFASALVLRAAIHGGWQGDLPAMRAGLNQLEQLPLAQRTDDRSVFVAMWAGLIEHRADRVETAATLTSRNYFDDTVIPMRPKAWLLALAHRRAGKENLARADWQAAEAVLRQRLQDAPGDDFYRAELAITLAWLDRREEAERSIGEVELRWKERWVYGSAPLLMRYYAALGDAAKAAPYLQWAVDRSLFTSRRVLPLDPWWDKIRGAPEFKALLKGP